MHWLAENGVWACISWFVCVQNMSKRLFPMIFDWSEFEEYTDDSSVGKPKSVRDVHMKSVKFGVWFKFCICSDLICLRSVSDGTQSSSSKRCCINAPDSKVFPLLSKGDISEDKLSSWRLWLFSPVLSEEFLIQVKLEWACGLLSPGCDTTSGEITIPWSTGFWWTHRSLEVTDLMRIQPPAFDLFWLEVADKMLLDTNH